MCIRFTNLLPFTSAQELDSLLEEFIDFQMMQDSDIPQCVWDKSTVVVNEASIWHHTPQNGCHSALSYYHEGS